MRLELMGKCLQGHEYLSRSLWPASSIGSRPTFLFDTLFIMQIRVFLFYVAMVGFALGIFLRSFFVFELPLITFVLLISFGVGVVWRKNCSAIFSPYLLAVSMLLFTIALGMVRMEVATWSTVSSPFSTLVGSEVLFDGVVVREPDRRESSTHLYVETDDEILLVIADRFGSYSYGDTVRIVGELRRPESFETELGRTFNYPGYLEARGVQFMVRYPEVTVLGTGAGNMVLSTLLDFKQRFMTELELLIPEPHVGLSEGLLLGVKRALGDELEQVFRKTGIIHIVVLSGYNIMLVVAFVTFVLSVLIPSRWQLPFGMVAISAFALMVGLSATVVRASVMAVLYLIARTLNRTYMVTRALMLAGATMLMLNPHLLAFDTGFQLSFVATLGLILLAPHLDQFFSFIPKLLGREFLVATLATQIFVLPILLYQIGEFSVVSVIVNVLVLPMVPVAMLLTFMTGMAGFVSSMFASMLSVFTYLSLAYILKIATYFAAFPFASYVVPAFPFWIVVLGYVILAYMVWKLSNKRQQAPRMTAERNHTAIIEKRDEIEGWLIEDEDEVLAKTAAGSRSDPAAADTPIFFR